MSRDRLLLMQALACFGVALIGLGAALRWFCALLEEMDDALT